MATSPAYPIDRRTDRVVNDPELMWVLFGIVLAIGVVVAWFGLMLLIGAGWVWSGIVCLFLGALTVAGGLIPRYRPLWLERWGLENPLR